MSSDLKHKSPQELVVIIQQGAKYRRRLEAEAKVLVEEISLLHNKISNSQVRSTWAVSYLEGSIEC